MKNIIIILIGFSLTVNALGQPPMREKMEERMKVQRIAFITQRLSLTETEAQQFWPIFNQYTEKLQQIRNTPKPDKPIDELADADIEKLIIAEFDKDSRELDLKKEYYQKLKKVISVKKIGKLYKSERDFRAELVKQLQEVRNLKKQSHRQGGQ